MKKTFVLLAILFTVTIAACGGSDGTEQETPSGASSDSSTKDVGDPATQEDLAGNTYSATAGEGIDITEQSPLEITFEEDEMSVDAGCNSISGNYTLDEGDLQAFLVTTLMGCTPKQQELEVFTTEMFRQGAIASISGDTLTLEGKNATTLTLVE